MNLRIKIVLFIALVSFITAKAQTKSTDTLLNKETARISKGFLTFELYNPLPSGDNAFGKSFSSIGGFNIKAKYDLYKGFFIGATTGGLFLKNTNPETVGVYDKSNNTYAYIFLGYDYTISKTITLGVTYSVFGTSKYQNIRANRQDIRHYDTSKFSVFEAYVDYKFSRSFAFYFNYGFRNDRLDIQTASTIQSQFDNAIYHNFGIGFKFIFESQSVGDLMNL